MMRTNISATERTGLLLLHAKIEMQRAIPFVDLNSLHDPIREELRAAFDRVLASGSFVLGPEVDLFEKAFAQYCSAGYALGVASGLDAMKLSLMALEVGVGDEVVVPAHGYQATWLAVVSVGATPVPVEPRDGSYLIDPVGIAAAITDRTKAIMPVHLYGEPCNMSAICKIAKEADVKIVEDAAQAHGAAWMGRRLGAHGDAVCWSFYPTKNLGAFGDGGAVTTNDPILAEKIKSLRNYGLDDQKTLEQVGLNSRLDELQAALLSVKLNHLDHWITERQRKADAYHSLLAGLNVLCPKVPQDASHTWHQFVIQVKDRDSVMSALKSRGIATDIHYRVPLADHYAFSNMGFCYSDFPKSKILSDRILSLPMSHRTSIDDLSAIAEALDAAT
jgi:dTDP-4-amino-4,6-dideoxygalactose transaminase